MKAVCLQFYDEHHANGMTKTGKVPSVVSCLEAMTAAGVTPPDRSQLSRWIKNRTKGDVRATRGRRVNRLFELQVLARLMFCVGVEEAGVITSRVVLNITFNYEAVRKAANLVRQAGMFL